MKQFFLSLIIILGISFLLNAQRTVVKINLDNFPANPVGLQLNKNTLSINENTPFIAFSASIETLQNIHPSDLNITLNYFTTNDESINISLKNDGHSNPENYVSELLFLPSDAYNFSFQIKNLINLENQEILFHFYNPQSTPNPENQANLRQLEDCNCPQPDYQSRADWCPTGNCPEGSSPAFTEVTHLVVHHSAGLNTASDWSAVVRSIWDYHVNSNGWDDVGYNWLIDPNGVIYEGRGNDIRGAHFCGNNTGTQGICMLGTYIDDAPTEAAMTSLKKYLAWKSANDNIDPTAVSFHTASNADIPHVAGHRDGCSTSCPGDMLYASMPQLRADIRQYQATICGHPHSVTNLELNLQNNINVLLSWSDNSSTEHEFWVQRATGVNGNFTTIQTLPTDSQSYTDTDAEAQTLYRYQVLSVAGDSTSTCQLEAQIMTQGTSGNSSILTSNEVNLLPNPAKDFIRLNLKNNYQGLVHIEIKDIMGRKTALNQSFVKFVETEELNLDLVNLATGVYFVQIKAGNAVGVFRFIKN